MANPQDIQWKRITVEATAIVVSILLAFAIDAFWDDRQDRKTEIDLIARVAKELNANAEIIERKLETLSVAVESTSEFLSWMGPEPKKVPRADLLEAWTKLYSIGTFALTRDASQEYLAEGRIDTAPNSDIRLSISQWYSGGDELENQYEVLREPMQILESTYRMLSRPFTLIVLTRRWQIIQRRVFLLIKLLCCPIHAWKVDCLCT
jgi:hypothetical protein